MCFLVTVWLSGCIIYHNLHQIPPFLEGPLEKWNLAEDDSFQVISCSILCFPSSISSQYQLSLAKQNKPAISFACFSPNINTLFPLPFLLLCFFFLLAFFFPFCWHLHVESSGREIRPFSIGSLWSSPPLELLSGCCSSPSVPRWKSVSFGNRPCSASDSADSPARVGIMWKKQIVKHINKDTQCWSMWLQQCCIQPVAKQHSALCLELWVYEPRSWISKKRNQSPWSPVYVCVWACVYMQMHKNGTQK